MTTAAYIPPTSPDTVGRRRVWRDDAACLGLGRLFLPDRVETIPSTAKGQALIASAKQVCAGCPVAEDCLTDAMIAEKGTDHHGRAGVRGGLTPQERALRARRELRGDAPPPTLLDRYLERTEAVDGGHVRWTVTTTSITHHGHTYTPRQLAWACATNRPPQGALLISCDMPNCVAVEHLTDAVMRRKATA
ncbi:WhiB family transcriptional regulator [Streptomyces virginiae]|uniref:WhiB family transcriptional regulator n=1 Tax=Streptomyces virginiae TaxID=1961 RepID=UPI0035E1658C